MLRVASLACTAFVLLAHTAGAQEQPVNSFSAEAESSAPAAWSAVDPLLAPSVEDAVPARVEVSAIPARKARSSFGRSALHTLGGAVVGAWLGYFTSQLVHSDWDKDSNNDFLNHRTSFALGGALFGGAGGLLIGSQPTDPVTASVRELASSDVQVITLEQVEAVRVANAYEVVQALQPQWLRARGIKSHTERGLAMGDENTPTVIIPGAHQVLVYLDEARLGGVEALRQVPTANVGSIRFLSSAQATFRWGTGHAHGVIWVQSRQ